MSSRRLPPLGAGPPPPYAFVSRVYKRSMRPIVLIVATIGAIWALFSTISSFQDLHLERTVNQPRLAPLSIVLGVLYLIAFAIEVYGVMSAISQRLVLVRLYAYVSIIAALIVITASLLLTIVHFTLKNDIITECIQVITNQTVTLSLGIWGTTGPTSTEAIDPADAASWCNDAWSHDSFSEVITLIVVIILSALFCTIAFSYYRQLLDPSSPANATRAPSNLVRMGAYPAHYSPPYDAPVPNLGYNYSSNYAPPPGAPPPRDEAFSPPYGNENKLPEYGVGLSRGRGDDHLGDSKDDPFSDYDGAPTRSAFSGEERDVTSGRPYLPG